MMINKIREEAAFYYYISENKISFRDVDAAYVS
mgnify:CR=1 FL=1